MAIFGIGALTDFVLKELNAQPSGRIPRITDIPCLVRVSGLEYDEKRAAAMIDSHRSEIPEDPRWSDIFCFLGRHIHEAAAEEADRREFATFDARRTNKPCIFDSAE